MAGDKVPETDSRGIPLKSVMPEKPAMWIIYTILHVVLGSIGLSIAWYFVYNPEANVKILIISDLGLGWLYLGILVLKILQIPLISILGHARKDAKIGLPDQQVYKVMGAEGSKLGYILMETDGALGDFNRAQRALMNYHENFPTTVLLYVAASFVFPFASFVCISIWAISRCINALGYKGSVNGRLNAALPEAIATSTLQGILMIVAKKALS